MADSVRRGQRFSQELPCPICGGWDRMPRGKGVRCWGYMGTDGKYAHCCREDLAGGMAVEKNGSTYAHRLAGDCGCGKLHGDAPVVDIDAARERRQRAAVVSETNYDYEGGLRVVRQDLADGDKKFLQKHKAAEGWAFGRGDAKPSLYRADEVRSADRHAFIFLVEGEKCADFLRMHGCVATTIAGGSNAGAWQWSADAARKLLKNRHVVLLPDADDVGGQLMEAAKKDLANVTQTLRLLPLPGLATDSGDDVVDWMQQGNREAEDLIRLAEAQPNLSSRRLPPLASEAARSIWSTPIPPAMPTGIGGLDRVIRGLCPESVALLNGPPGRGKSALAIQIASHIAAELRTAGTGQEVVYLSSELSERQVLARFAAQILRVPWLRLYEEGPSEADKIAAVLDPLALRVIEIKAGMSIRGELDLVADITGHAPVCTADYLQHIARRLGKDDLKVAVSQVSDELTTWTRDTKSTALAVSSVSRTNYKGDEHAGAEQYVSAGKESGDLDFDATPVLYLEAELAPEGGSAPAKLHVAKQRHGPGGQSIGLRFFGALGLFEDDAGAGLTELELDVYRAVFRGAKSANEVQEQIGVKRPAVLGAVKALALKGIIDRPLLRVLKEVPC